GGPADQEVEGKVLLDRRFGPVLAAFNLIAAHEWEGGPLEAERELEIETDLAAAYLFPQGFSAGLELRTHTGIPAETGWETPPAFPGPAVSYVPKPGWASASVMPQLFALQPAGATTIQDLDHHEAFTARFIFGWHL